MCNTTKETMTVLRESKVRVTPQRRVILECLANTKKHPSADQIYRSIEKDLPNVSLATVYKNLHFLADKGIIKELMIDGTSRFDYNTSEHYHLVCKSCKKIEDIAYPLFREIEVFAEERYGYEVHSHSLELYGLCATCQKEKEKNSCSNCELYGNCMQ